MRDQRKTVEEIGIDRKSSWAGYPTKYKWGSVRDVKKYCSFIRRYIFRMLFTPQIDLRMRLTADIILCFCLLEIALLYLDFMYSTKDNIQIISMAYAASNEYAFKADLSELNQVTVTNKDHSNENHNIYQQQNWFIGWHIQCKLVF